MQCESPPPGWVGGFRKLIPHINFPHRITSFFIPFIMFVNKIKLFWRLKKSQWFQSSKCFCDWVRMNICVFSHMCSWFIPQIWLANSVHMDGQWDALGWPIDSSLKSGWLIMCTMAGQWDTLGWTISWGEGILGAPLGPCVIGYTFWVVVHPAGTLTRPGVHTRIAELAS